MSKLSVFESLSLSTVRIECELANGDTSAGTGFFTRFAVDGDSFVPAVVTNKHVIEGAVHGRLFLTLSAPGGGPQYGSHHRFEIPDFSRPWIPHPDPDIDLCAMPINVLIDALFDRGMKAYITFIDLSLIPSEEDVAEMGGMERVIMIGYPTGLWDETHNQPILRSGVLASHYRFNWQGRPESVIDASCVPGSSGSPVMIVDLGQVFTRHGLNIGATRIKFLGVLYAGPMLLADGSIEIKPASTSTVVRTRTRVPINLGYIIKSTQLFAFEGVFRSELARNRGGRSA